MDKLNGAMVSIEPSTGDILALVGGVDYKKSQYNRATQGRRQPGSAFKPLIYQVAVDLGYSGASQLVDIARTYDYELDGEEKKWKPKNYGKDYKGFISLREALVHSRNLATINLVTDIGLTTVRRQLSKYHASGVMSTKLNDAKTTYFKHNDADALETLLKDSKAKRKVIAVEGIYSMDADLLKIEIIHLADKYDALLILDEAHSSGVIGKNLMGILDYYHLPVKQNYIKMGTLGKAYGSFGAYILGSSHIIDYLINRAKPIIYATAPSLFDTALGQVSLEYILGNSKELNIQIKEYQEIVKDVLCIKIEGLIVPINIGDNVKVMQIQAELMNENYLVGAIRQPTVDSAIIRLIARLGVSKEDLLRVCNLIQANLR
ncbi:MAG TPA: aminotransferase class I/II-fold pyridoxal phosphate-dependent enzyme, partial [Sulfurimonas sp.]|nr:aminotransferase class I/II-fold pyridoxal phosphate-dependent enzyme [Sulfurimonas sp.]